MISLVRGAGLVCLAAWIVLEYVQYRRFGYLDIESQRDLARRKWEWMGRHPVLLALLTQAFVVGFVAMLTLPLFFIAREDGSAFGLDPRVLIVSGVACFVSFGILRLWRIRKRRPGAYLRIEAMALVAWSSGLCLTCF